MIYGYTKLHGSILGSTIWQKDLAIKVTWVTMLALADKHGSVHTSIPGLAHFAGVTIEQAESAILDFLAPDSYSRTSDHEGRRIEVIDGGWQLLNHDKYRYLLSEDDRKERDTERHRKRRDRMKAACQAENMTKRDNEGPSVTEHDIVGQTGNVREIQQSEAETESLKDISSNADASDDTDLLNALKEVWDYYIAQVGRDPRIYSFTPIRQRIGLKRLKECLAETDNKLENALELMQIAVDKLAASDWHMGRDLKTNGKKYCEWEHHLFKSYEQMERWWNQ